MLLLYMCQKLFVDRVSVFSTIYYTGKPEWTFTWHTEAKLGI